MPINHEEWQSIDRRIADLARPSEFVQGKVIKVDKKKNVVWLKECGDQPIPIYAFNYSVKYYDIDQNGNTRVRKAETIVILPKKGDIVLIAKQFGSRRLPKCLGVLRSKDFALEEGD